MRIFFRIMFFIALFTFFYHTGRQSGLKEGTKSKVQYNIDSLEQVTRNSITDSIKNSIARSLMEDTIIFKKGDSFWSRLKIKDSEISESLAKKCGFRYFYKYGELYVIVPEGTKFSLRYDKL